MLDSSGTSPEVSVKRMAKGTAGVIQFILIVASAFLPIYLGFFVAHLLPRVGGFKSGGITPWFEISIIPIPWFFFSEMVEVTLKRMTVGLRKEKVGRAVMGVVGEIVGVAILTLLSQIVFKSLLAGIVVAVVGMSIYHVFEPYIDRIYKTKE